MESWPTVLRILRRVTGFARDGNLTLNRGKVFGSSEGVAIHLSRAISTDRIARAPHGGEEQRQFRLPKFKRPGMIDGDQISVLFAAGMAPWIPGYSGIVAYCRQGNRPA